MRVAWKNWRAWVAIAVVLLACSPVRAFYWYGWPGSRLRVEPSLISPPFQTAPGNPPTQPPFQPPPVEPEPTTPPPMGPDREPMPPLGPPVVLDRPPVGPPEPTPEPSTAVIGLLGLGAIAAVRRWRHCFMKG